MIGVAAHKLGRLTGWRRLSLSFLAGAITIFAFAPFSVVPVLWIAFPVLLWLLDGCKTWRTALATGWAFGFGQYVTGFWWITNALLVDSETFGAIAYPAVTALTAAIGIFIGIVAAITHLIPPSRDEDMPDDHVAIMTLRILLFAGAWTLIEWVRSWIFTGFAWNPTGAVWSGNSLIGLSVIQVTTLIGTHGLTLLTVIVALAPAVLAKPPRSTRAWVTAAAPVMVFAIIGGGGAWRLSTTQTEFEPGVKFRLVQAAISQKDRARPSLWESQLQDYVTLSTTDRPADVTHVIWGEAAMPFMLNADERHRLAVAAAAPSNGFLIVGADRGVNDGEKWTELYNALYVITPSAEVVAGYDKAHLVPFGEYMPARWLIPYDKIAGGYGDFNAGPGLTTLNVAGLPAFTPLICYEVIFSGQVTPAHFAGSAARPKWLLNLTNDAWFGMSTGPYQHYAMARLRAVEEGLPLVRVANTGISAVIDSRGQTVSELGLGQRGVVDAGLPAATAGITPFGFIGNMIPVGLATLTAAFALLNWRRRSTRPI